MLTFIQSLYFSLGICAFFSFFVFFAKRFQIFAFGCFGFLSGVIYLLLKTDVFAGVKEGRWAASSIFLMFLFEFLSYLKLKEKQMPQLFYGLPFLAFVSLAISVDLLGVLLGLMLFGLSFVLLESYRGWKNIQTIFLKINVGFLAFSYGIAVIFSRIGVFKLSDLRLQLAIKSSDNWLMFGFGLLCLAVVVELYAVLETLKRNKK